MTEQAEQPKPKGRPKGASNIEFGVVVVVPQCPVCKSSARERYRLVSYTKHGGITSSGYEYSHTVKRRTRCTNCGKRRIDTFLENAVPKANPGEVNEPGDVT